MKGEKGGVSAGPQLRTVSVTVLHSVGAEKGGNQESLFQAGSQMLWETPVALPAHSSTTYVKYELNFQQVVRECASSHTAPEVPFLTKELQMLL